MSICAFSVGWTSRLPAFTFRFRYLASSEDGVEDDILDDGVSCSTSHRAFKLLLQVARMSVSRVYASMLTHLDFSQHSFILQEQIMDLPFIAQHLNPISWQNSANNLVPLAMY